MHDDITICMNRTNTKQIMSSIPALFSLECVLLESQVRFCLTSSQSSCENTDPFSVSSIGSGDFNMVQLQTSSCRVGFGTRAYQQSFLLTGEPQDPVSYGDGVLYGTALQTRRGDAFSPLFPLGTLTKCKYSGLFLNSVLGSCTNSSKATINSFQQ